MSLNLSTDNRVRHGVRRTGALLAAGSAVIAGGVPLLAINPAAADDILTVTTLDDSGSGSLREAIGLANADADHDTIVFSVTGTISLASSLPVFQNYGATIVGDGITVDGNGFGVFSFNQMQDRTEVHISGITITDGANGYGGAIRADSGAIWPAQMAEISLTNVTVTGSSSFGRGGALYLYGADTISIVNSTITGNTSGDDGGGAFIGNTSSVQINNSVFEGNDAYDTGGGVAINGWNALYDTKSITIQGSSFEGNSAGSDGGGLYIESARYNTEDVSLIISESVMLDNTSGAGGGGIFLGSGDNGGDFTLINSTISNNDAGGWGGGLYLSYYWANSVANTTITGNYATVDGGAIYGAAGGISITNSTIAANTAGEDVGGIQLGGQALVPVSIGTTATEPGQVTIFGSIIAANSGLDVAEYGSATPAVTATHSLIGTVSETLDFTAGIGTQTGIDPAELLLGELTDNGGPTPTHALGAGSIAIDAGGDGSDMPEFTGSEFDQRGTGYDRIVNGLLDVGAFEVQAVVPDTTTTTAGSNPVAPVVPVFTG